MRRFTALAGLTILCLGFTACGGGSGGGDETTSDELCKQLDALSGSISEGDLATAKGLEGILSGSLRGVVENANDDQFDDANEARRIVQEADPEEAEQTAEDLQDALGDLAKDCDVDDFAELPTTTTTEPEETTTTTEPEGTSTTEITEPEPLPNEENVLSAWIDPAAIIAAEPEFATPVQECSNGNFASCDILFFGDDSGTGNAPSESLSRSYGATCGGRITSFADDKPVTCEENFSDALPHADLPFTDESFRPLADSCQAGDMASCDQLYTNTSLNSGEEYYGQTCGLRLDPVITTRDNPEGNPNCADIFGPTYVD